MLLRSLLNNNQENKVIKHMCKVSTSNCISYTNTLRIPLKRNMIFNSFKFFDSESIGIVYFLDFNVKRFKKIY